MALILVYVRKTNYFEKRECFYPELNGQPHCSQLQSKLDQSSRDVKIESNCFLMIAKHEAQGLLVNWNHFPCEPLQLELRFRISIAET